MSATHAPHRTAPHHTTPHLTTRPPYATPLHGACLSTAPPASHPQAELFHVKRSRHAPVSAEDCAPATGAAQNKRVLVLYGSETGTAEAYAYETAAKLRSFASHVSLVASYTSVFVCSLDD